MLNMRLGRRITLMDGSVVSFLAVDESMVAAGNTKDVNVGANIDLPYSISERFDNTAYGFFLGTHVAYPVVANYFSSIGGLDSMLENGVWFIRNNPLILKKCNPNVNLLKEDVGNVLVWVKLHGVPVTVFSEDGLSSITTKLDPSQAPRGVSVGPKVGFKLLKQVYRLVSKNNNANTSGNKKKYAESRKEANSGRSSSWNVGSSSTSATPIIEKIDKLGRLIIDGKFPLVDDESKPLEKVDYLGDHDSENEVEPVDNEMESFLSSKRSKPQEKVDYLGDHDSENEVEPVDNEMECFLSSKRVGYGQEIPDNIQSLCDNLDIKVRGRKKK
ncbi:retrotransposon protein, putative, unclassified [Tanacetum coccineum]